MTRKSGSVDAIPNFAEFHISRVGYHGLSIIEHHGANQSIHRFQRMRWSSEASWIQIALASLLGSKTGAPSGGWQSAAEGKMSSACLSILAWLKIEGADQSSHSRWHLVRIIDSSHIFLKKGRGFQLFHLSRPVLSLLAKVKSEKQLEAEQSKLATQVSHWAESLSGSVTGDRVPDSL